MDASTSPRADAAAPLLLAAGEVYGADLTFEDCSGCWRSADSGSTTLRNFFSLVCPRESGTTRRDDEVGAYALEFVSIAAGSVEILRLLCRTLQLVIIFFFCLTVIACACRLEDR